jgi:hypothetical protein
MTKFTEAFYPAYRQATSNLVAAKETWKVLEVSTEAGTFKPEPMELFLLHEAYEITSDLVIALENLRGLYVQSYEGSESQEDVKFNEKSYLTSLNNLLKR